MKMKYLHVRAHLKCREDFWEFEELLKYLLLRYSNDDPCEFVILKPNSLMNKLSAHEVNRLILNSCDKVSICMKVNHDCCMHVSGQLSCVWSYVSRRSKQNGQRTCAVWQSEAEVSSHDLSRRVKMSDRYTKQNIW